MSLIFISSGEALVWVATFTFVQCQNLHWIIKPIAKNPLNLTFISFFIPFHFIVRIQCYILTTLTAG